MSSTKRIFGISRPRRNTIWATFSIVGTDSKNIIAIAAFLAGNIPTIIFGGIWLHYKGSRDTLNDLKRIQVEDLK